MFVIVSHNKFTLTLVCCISISNLNRKYNDNLDIKAVLSKLMRFNLLPFSCYSRQFRGLFFGWITDGIMWLSHVCSLPYRYMCPSIAWRSFRKGDLSKSASEAWTGFACCRFTFYGMRLSLMASAWIDGYLFGY